MVDIVHGFCAEVYTSLTPTNQWTTNVSVPLPEKGDLTDDHLPWNIPLINQREGVQQDPIPQNQRPCGSNLMKITKLDFDQVEVAPSRSTS